MKLKIRLFVLRDSNHAGPDRLDAPTLSARLVPLAHTHSMHSDETRQNAMAIWPKGVNGEIELHHCDADIMRNMRAGKIVDMTLEIPD